MREVVDSGVLRDLHKYVYNIGMKRKAIRGDHSGIIGTGVLSGRACGADLTSPSVSPNLTGNIFAFAIIDYTTRRVLCYFIKTTDEAFAITKHFLG